MSWRRCSSSFPRFRNRTQPRRIVRLRDSPVLYEDDDGKGETIRFRPSVPIGRWHGADTDMRGIQKIGEAFQIGAAPA